MHSMQHSTAGRTLTSFCTKNPISTRRFIMSTPVRLHSDFRPQRVRMSNGARHVLTDHSWAAPIHCDMTQEIRKACSLASSGQATLRSFLT